MNRIIGLTGGIGSGKSTVLQLFKDLGLKVYVADNEAKTLMNTDTELIGKIKSLLGENAYENNQLNRKFISSEVFGDKNKLKALNKLVHPRVREHFLNFLKQKGEEPVVYEAAILFESGSDELCDLIITVTANVEDRIDRIIKRDGVSRQDVVNRMRHQWDDNIKILNAHFVIENDTFEATKARVATTYDLIREYYNY